MDPTRVKDLLFSALELGESEREAYLTEACAGDTELERELRALLQAHGRAQGVFEDDALALDEIGFGVGDRIGEYVLTRVIGQGGFGTVFLAQQERPVRRPVALKVIKVGMDTRAVVARFEAERQVLAMMEHPNIARVLDAGATSTGRPYFVMELAEGEPITEYCNAHALGLEARLKLFSSVCDAIQHAHQKGVVHRDVKPSNVLVTLVDGSPVVKVIDFGVAKIIEPETGLHSLVTRIGQFIGTPAYMSPEQASGQADVDTRSDVYALGVLLYELLVGTPPFSPARLRALGIEEVLRTIREAEPPRPSARLRELRAESSTETTMSSSVPRDLDWIVMHAIEKDRTRRYPTASSLALDVERFLHHEPVQAAPPSELYRIRKLVRRHRVAAWVAAGLLLTLVLASVGTSMGLFALRRANRELSRETSRAQRAEQKAAERAEITRNINDFLTRDLLGAAVPSVDPGAGRDVTVREVLDVAAARIAEQGEQGGRFADSPGVEAAIRLTLGASYNAIGAAELAVHHLERAVELGRMHDDDDSIDALRARVTLGNSLWQLGRNTQAEELLKATLASLTDAVGPEHALTLEAATALTTALREQGRFAEAQELGLRSWERARAALGEAHEITLNLMVNLANVADGLGQLETAQELNERIVTIRREELGPDHPLTLVSTSNLAATHLKRGRFAEAEELLRDTVRLDETVMGPEHFQTLSARHNLAIAFLGQGRHEEAEALVEETLERARRARGERDARTLALLTTLVRVRMAQDRLEEAEELVRSVVGLSSDVLGPEHPATLSRRKDLANVLFMRGRSEESKAILEDNLAIELRVLGPSHPNTVRTRSSLGLCCLELGQSAEALAHYREALPHARRALGADHAITRRIEEALAQGEE